MFTKTTEMRGFKTPRLTRLFGLAAAIALSMVMVVAQPGHAEDLVSGHVLVRVQPGADIQRLATDFHTTVQKQVSGTNLYSLGVPGTESAAAFATQLSADTRVVYAEPDQLVTSPEVKGEPFHFAFDVTTKPTVYVNSAAYVQVNLGSLDAFAQANGNGILVNGAGVVVAVVDTGAALDHPALTGHFIAGFNAIYPGLAPVDEPDGVTNNEVGHGTMIAGIIARLAPQAKIMPVRVLNGDGAGTVLNLVQGIHYATTHGARIINMSFGCATRSSALSDALDEAELAGLVLIASAGNDNISQPLVPAVGKGAMAVGAVEFNNVKSPYSNYGSFVDVVAPGSVFSTYWNGGYASWAGTSFSAPFVTAEAALMFSKQPSLTAEVIISTIRKTAHSVDNANPAYRNWLGKGIIDIEAAVRAVNK